MHKLPLIHMFMYLCSLLPPLHGCVWRAPLPAQSFCLLCHVLSYLPFSSLFWIRRSLCIPDCPGSHYVDRSGCLLAHLCLILSPDCWQYPKRSTHHAKASLEPVMQGKLSYPSFLSTGITGLRKIRLSLPFNLHLYILSLVLNEHSQSLKYFYDPNTLPLPFI